METGPKRFSISVTEELAERLRKAREIRYPHKSMKEVLTDLIEKGLKVSAEKKEEE